MIKAVIFDFDYTLGDSTNGIVLSANYALEKMGHRICSTDMIKKTIGLSLKDTYVELTNDYNLDNAEEFRRLFVEMADKEMVDNTVLYDGVKGILKALKANGIKVGIVTTKFGYRIEAILKKFDATELVDLIIGSDNVKVEKPNPEGLLMAVERLKLEKDELIYIGDSIVDAKTAVNAGVPFAGVLTGTTTREEFMQYANVCIGNSVAEVIEARRIINEQGNI